MVPKVTDYLGPPIRLTDIRYSNNWIGFNQQSLPPIAKASRSM